MDGCAGDLGVRAPGLDEPLRDDIGDCYGSGKVVRIEGMDVEMYHSCADPRCVDGRWIGWIEVAYRMGMASGDGRMKRAGLESWHLQRRNLILVRHQVLL